MRSDSDVEAAGLITTSEDTGASAGANSGFDAGFWRSCETRGPNLFITEDCGTSRKDLTG